MKNKVLINVYVVSLDEQYNIYVPISGKVGEIGNLIAQGIKDLSDYSCFDNGYCLMDMNSGKFYNLDQSIKNTDIRNDKNLIMFGI